MYSIHYLVEPIREIEFDFAENYTLSAKTDAVFLKWVKDTKRPTLIRELNYALLSKNYNNDEVLWNTW